MNHHDPSPFTAPPYVAPDGPRWLPGGKLEDSQVDGRTRGLDTVLEGLASLGFDVAWGVFGAHHVRAPHKRDRMWIVASHPDRCREREQPEHAEVARASSAGGDIADADCERQERRSPARGGIDSAGRGQTPDERDIGWWELHRFAGVDDGVASRVERVRATGNGQVPAVASLAWKTLSAVLEFANP